ncbi:uncharacterized protein LOC129586136 isoform X2 [Paramacrobiotus metropolitanus]|nr:uncharacterized protein LOC129586136 isoform X2 [Paramacrobiotus metropolitanus]
MEKPILLVSKVVAFKFMPLNLSAEAAPLMSSSDQPSAARSLLVPHVMSTDVTKNNFLPICDPNALVSHLICREAGFETFRELKEVDVSLSVVSDYVTLTCKSTATSINECILSSIQSCSRLSHIICGSCGGTVHLQEDKPLVVMSPGFPSRILPVVACQWTFLSPTPEYPVTVQFDDFELLEDCKTSGVMVGSLLRSGQLLISGKRFCGSEKPEDFESDSPVAVLNYYSWYGYKAPQNVFMRGFRAVVRTKVVRDDVHLGVALGFTAAALVVLAIIGAIYHKRITKFKRRNEYAAKAWTRNTLAGATSPDHVYQSMPVGHGNPHAPLNYNRQPLRTIYIAGGPAGPELPPRSPSLQAAHDIKYQTAGSGNEEVESEYVTPNRSLLDAAKKPVESTLQFLKSVLKTRAVQPVSDGFLARNTTIRRRDRASSFPLLGDATSDMGNEYSDDSTYVSVMSTDTKKHLGSAPKTPSTLDKFTGDKSTLRKSGSVPEINLEDCNDKGCTFVKKL